MSVTVEQSEDEWTRSRRPAASRLRPFAWHGAIALIVAAPLLRGGYLLLLDFALVRRVSIAWQPTEANPGPVNGAPAEVLLWLLAHLGYAAGPLIVFGLFLLMGLAAHHAVVRLVGPENRVAAYFAGTLYAVNPFTYDRLMQGHIFLLAAYGLVPLLVVAADRFVRRPNGRTAAVLAAFITAIAWTSLHILAMLPFLLLLGFAFRRDTWRRAVLRWGAVALLAIVLANLWWIVGLFRVQPGELVTVRDVDAYATQPVGRTVVGNVAGLYGFWRHEFRLPKDGVEFWWLLFLPIAGLVLYGAAACARDRRLRPLGVGLIAIVPVAILLASGTSFSPTSGMFRWLFDNVPGFKLFREPQKWVALLPLSYAILGAIGLDRLIRPTGERRDRRLMAAVTAAALLLPCAYAWTLLWNWDRFKPVRYPADWAAAESTMLDAGGGTLLFLPWHLYMTMSFTGRRVVNPAPYYFTGPVISGDNVELPGIPTQSQNPTSKAVERVLFDAGRRNEFGRTLSSFCVLWVALAKETDFAAYAWLNTRRELERVLDGPTITLWRTHVRLAETCRSR